MTGDLTYRWRKTTDVSRDGSLFELMEGEVPILDLGFSAAGELEVMFNPFDRGRLITYTQLVMLLDEGVTLAKGEQK